MTKAAPSALQAPQANAWIHRAPIYKAGEHADHAIVLSANENPLGASPLAYEAMAEIDLHRYPHGDATELRQAIAEHYNLTAENIICGAGSDELITLLIRCYCEPGDNIVYSQHGFLMYAISAQLAGVEPIKAPEKNYRSDPQAIADAITPKTKIIFIANPNNPTGSYLTQAETEALVARVPSHIVVALDGAYAEYARHEDPDGYNAGEKLCARYGNVVMLRTFSKLYGLAALRVGWIVAAENIAAAINRVRSPFNLSQAGQVAAMAALGDNRHIDESLAVNLRNKRRLQQAIRQLGLDFIASATNFLAVDFATETRAQAALRYLHERNILVRDIRAYDMARHLRITIGSDSDTDNLVSVLTAFCEGD